MCVVGGGGGMYFGCENVILLPLEQSLTLTLNSNMCERVSH